MTDLEKDMKRWTLFMPEDLLNELKQIAELHQTTASKLTRIACAKYIAAVKKATQMAEDSNAA